MRTFHAEYVPAGTLTVSTGSTITSTPLLTRGAPAEARVQLEDFEVADAIFVFGQNPGSNHPRMLVALEKAARRGATRMASPSTPCARGPPA